MTLSELSLRNAKRQAKDYLVYFVTVIMAAALLYSFNGLIFSREVQEISDKMSQLPLMIAMADIVVVCIFGWLVSYSTGFMLTRRSRELGTYILIGLENSQVARLFFLENAAVGGCALIIGTLIGGLLYQAFRAIVMTLFGTPYHFAFTFSLKALALTTLCFALIWLHALRKGRKRIRTMKIYDLIYFEKQNEETVIRTAGKRRILFTASVLFGIAGTLLLMAGDMLAGMIGAGFVIFFLYGFFLSFSSGIPAFFDKRPVRKYRGRNLLVFRTLTAKLNTTGILMATISLLLTATLISEGTGLIFRGIFEGRSAEKACFDLYIGIDDALQDPRVYLDYIDANIPVKSSLSYNVYSGEDARIMDYLDANIVFYHYDYGTDPVIRYGDYAVLRSLAGYEPVELEPGHCLIHCMPYLKDTLQSFSQSVTAGGLTLTPGDIRTEHLAQNYGTGNGHGYIIVVPDEAAESLSVHHRAYVAATVSPVTEDQFAALRAINESDSRANPMAYDAIYSKSDEKSDTAAMTALTVFPMYYLALALTMTAATILTIQQLSESKHYGRQFLLLHKLGMERREMLLTLRTWLTVYYAMPAVPPVLIGVPFILNLAKAPEPGIMVGINSPAAIVGISLTIFFIVYAVYIVMAYVCLKRNVLPADA